MRRFFFKITCVSLLVSVYTFPAYGGKDHDDDDGSSSSASTRQLKPQNVKPFKKLSSTYSIDWGINRGPNMRTRARFDIAHLSDQDQLAFNTVQIRIQKRSEEQDEDGQIIEMKISEEIGTGFFIGKEVPNRASDATSPKEQVFLFTCKHCVEEGDPHQVGRPYELRDKFIIYVHYINQKNKKFTLLEIALDNKTKKVPWKQHPEKDMAFLPFQEILFEGKQYLENSEPESSYEPFIRVIPYPQRPEESTSKAISLSKYEYWKPKKFGYLTDVVMFGYPYERSAPNKMPLARYGHCASDPNYSLDEIKSAGDFYIDMATIAGSSGSSVWFFRKTYTSNIDTEVEVEGDLDDDAVEGDKHEGWKLSSTSVNATGRLDLGDVDIDETLEFSFGGMVISGAEGGDGPPVHLGLVINAQTIFDFLKDETESTSAEE